MNKIIIYTSLIPFIVIFMYLAMVETYATLFLFIAGVVLFYGLKRYEEEERRGE